MLRSMKLNSESPFTLLRTVMVLEPVMVVEAGMSSMSRLLSRRSVSLGASRVSHHWASIGSSIWKPEAMRLRSAAALPQPMCSPLSWKRSQEVTEPGMRR